MKIGDLFVSLGLKSDRKSFDKARNELGRFTKDADSKFAKLGSKLSNVLGAKLGGGFGGKSIGTLKGVTGGLKKVGIVATGIGAGLVLAAKDALEFDDSLTRLDISSRGAMGSMAKVKGRVLEVSKATGVSKEELVAGSAAFVALTGDGKMASDSMETFAKVTKATGSPIEDVVGAAASLNEQLGIGAKEFERAFSILIAGGKAGKIELKDMANLTASLAAGYKQFGGSKGIGGVATLGSAFQIVAKNFGSASEAATGLDALMGSILQNAKDLKAIGVDPYEKDGKTLRSLEAITEDIGKKDLNATKVLGLLKRKEAVKTYNALHDNRKQWEEIRASTLKANDVQEDYAKYGKSASAQLGKAWNEIKVAIAESFTPEVIGAFVLAIKDTISLVKDLVRGLGAVAEKLEEIAGGDEAKLTKQGQDDKLDNVLLGGKFSLADIEKINAMPNGPSKIGPIRELGKAAGFDDEIDIANAGDDILKAATRRTAQNSIVAKQDAARARKNFPDQAYDTNLNDPSIPFLGNEGPVLSPGDAGGSRTLSIGPTTLNVSVPPAMATKEGADFIAMALREYHENMVRDLDAATGGE